MVADNRILATWRRLAATPGGKRVFARLVCTRTPYAAGIRPTFEVVEAGHVEIRMARRRTLLDGDANLHHMALATLAELAAQVVTQTGLPATHACEVHAISTRQLHPAQGDVTALARAHIAVDTAMPTEHDIDVDLRDSASRPLYQARVTMRVMPRRRGHPRATPGQQTTTDGLAPDES